MSLKSIEPLNALSTYQHTLGMSQAQEKYSLKEHHESVV